MNSMSTDHIRKISTLYFKNERGSALIVTLLLVAILVALVTEFVYETFIDSASLNNWSNAQKATLIARSGQNLSGIFIDELNENTYSDRRLTELEINEELGKNTTLNVTIEDENARFNINSIIYSNGLTNDKALSSLKKLLEFLNINPNLSLVIADYIDPDREPRLSDSEDNAKNTFFWSVDEIVNVDGIDNDIFSRLKVYVTVYGNGLININSAELPVLVCLSNEMNEDLARNIINYRESTPFEDKSSVVRVSGLEAIGINIIDRITVKSSIFRVVSEATVNEIGRVIESVIDSQKKIHFWRET